MKEATLIIKHLPETLSPLEKEDFLKAFGASSVKVMALKGRFKHTAFATFNSRVLAEKALFKLHNLTVLKRVLSAEFTREQSTVEGVELPVKNNLNASTEKSKTPNNKKSLPACPLCVPPVAAQLGLKHPKNPGLKYKYPELNADVLINICTALLAVPRLYTQVLHLMNKMNLLAPFSPATHIPPVLTEALLRHIDPKVVKARKHNLSEGESEMDSDGSKEKEAVLKVKKPVKRHLEKPVLDLLPKLMRRTEVSNKPLATAVTQRAEVFEGPEFSKPTLKLHIPTEVSSNKEATKEQPKTAVGVDEEGVFGKIILLENSNKEAGSESSEQRLKTFITAEKLQEGCLTAKEMKANSLFRKYEAGMPSCRLYVKNLAKKTTEKDLEFIFGSFVNFVNEDEAELFNCRVMTGGRMKGQAFVGLPSEESAVEALRATNGYQLNGKPMIVCYARSSKPKQAT